MEILESTTHPKADLPILVMAGHADSQRMTGSGTPGRAVDVGGATPMQAGMTDELFWNLLTAKAMVEVALETDLRNPRTRHVTLKTIALRVVKALRAGLKQEDADHTAMRKPN